MTTIDHPAPTLAAITDYAATIGLSVLPSSYRTGRDAGGAFASIDTVPEGYRLQAWHERDSKGEITIYGEY